MILPTPGAFKQKAEKSHRVKILTLPEIQPIGLHPAWNFLPWEALWIVR